MTLVTAHGEHLRRTDGSGEVAHREHLGRAAGFGAFAAVQASHAAGDAALAVALAHTLFFAVPVGAARSSVATYLALTLLPSAVVRPTLGRLLDGRVGPGRLVLASAVLRAVAASLLLVRTATWQLYPLVLGMLVASRAHGISRSAIIPHVVSGKLLPANTRLSIISGAGSAIGAGSAAMSIRVSSPPLLPAIVAYAAAALLALPLAATIPTHARSSRGEHHVVRPASCTIPSNVRAAALAMVSIRATVGFVTFFLALVLKRDGSVTALALAALAAAVGAAAGLLSAPALGRVVSEAALPVALLGAVAVTACCTALTLDAAAASAAAAVVGFAGASARLGFDSVAQRQVPDAVRGGTFTRYDTLMQLGWAGGAAVSMAPLRPHAGMALLATFATTATMVATRHRWGRLAAVPSACRTSASRISAATISVARISAWAISLRGASARATSAGRTLAGRMLVRRTLAGISLRRALLATRDE